MVLQPERPWTAAQRYWCWEDLFGDATVDDVTLSWEERERHRSLMWRDLSTEYDARYFETFVVAQNFKMTSEFRKLFSAWRHDEQQHYDALRRMFSLLYHLPEYEIERRVELQESDFRPIAHLFTDEFRVLVLLAFDEIIGARGYLSEVPMYASFGHPGFVQWVKSASKDETVHARNALTLIKHRHGHRIPEASCVLSEILEFLVENQSEYKGTFALDNSYDEESLLTAADWVRVFLS